MATHSESIRASFPALKVKSLGLCEYAQVWRAMQAFTDQRTPETSDELWLVEHPPVFTQGLAGKPEHVLNPGTIPIIQTDRGGQVTYHGPGQLVFYPLIDIDRLGLGVRKLVCNLEQSVIDLMTDHQVEADRKAGAPGVFVDGEKIASIGLKVRRGCTFHGLALNVDLDLSPFSLINPCGVADQRMTRWVDCVPDAYRHIDKAVLARRWVKHFARSVGLDAQHESADDETHALLPNHG